VIAVLLHYFYLVGFFMMLAEGVEMLLYIVFVFHIRRRAETGALIFAAWCKSAHVSINSLHIISFHKHARVA
jgi:7 transmembrane receptor (Secretin family)